MQRHLITLLLLAVTFGTSAKAQALAAGDICFIGFNSDNTDQFSIICANSIAGGAVVYFTDAGWDGSAFYASEGHFKWTVPAGGLASNTIVTFTGGSLGAFTIFGTGAMESGVSVSSGSLSATASTSSFALSTSGDQILVYTGSMASPTFIACVNFNAAWSFTTPNLSEQTLVPSGLSDGTNCVLLTDHDNQEVDCNLLPDPATIYDYNNATYWIYNDATRYTLPPAFVCDVLLPVTLSQISATPVSSQIFVQWITASEENSHEFIVERFANGNFVPLGSIPASGNSLQEQFYTFIDDSPLAGINYYRLKMVDLNGQYAYSDVVTAFSNSDQPVVYPNPTSGNFHLTMNLQTGNSSTATISVLDLMGVELYSEKIDVDDKILDHSFYIDDLKPGNYIIRIQSGGTVSHAKLQVR